jgi:hypothetical protein
MDISSDVSSSLRPSFCQHIGRRLPLAARAPRPTPAPLHHCHWHPHLWHITTLLSNFYHNPETHFTLSTSSMYFSLLYFIPVSEYLRVTISARADLNYTIMLSWMWGSGLRGTFINLKSHSQPLYKSLFFTHRRGSLSFQRLSF